MYVKIFRVALKSLRNGEYTMFVSQIVAIFQKYNAEALHLKKSFNKLLAMGPSLEKIKAQEQSSSFSNMIRDLDLQRDNIFSAIVAMVKSLEKSGINTLSVDVLLMNRLLDKHGRNIAQDSYNAETERLNDLFVDIDSSAELTLATAKLNLTFLLEQLRAINADFASKYLLRTEKESSIEEVDSRAIRMESDKILLEFFKAFEFCSSEYDELDYKTPANELNELITHYKTQLKARETRRKLGKDTTDEKPIEGK